MNVDIEGPLTRPDGNARMSFSGKTMVLRNIIGRAARERGWELVCWSSVMQRFVKGDTTIKVRYFHHGAIWLAEWCRDGQRRDLASQDRNKRDVIIAWFGE